MLYTMLEQLKICEEQVAQSLMELYRIREKISEVYGMDKSETSMPKKDIPIPFAAYEMQLERHLEEKRDIEDRHLAEKEKIAERHEAEKDKMRKHYRRIIAWIASVLLLLIVGIFGTAIWFLNTTEFMDATQELSTGDNGTAYIEDGIHYNQQE